MPILTSAQPSNFVIPGSYITEVAATPTSPSNQPQTSLIAVNGTGQWGAPNVPIPVTGGAAGIVAAIGSNTQLPHSIADAVLNGTLPECQNYLLNRVTDGTDTGASWNLNDNLGNISGTFYANSTGSLANNTPTSSAGGRCDQITPNGSMSPVYRITTFFPGITEVFTVAAYAVPGGGFNEAAFQANLSAAINYGTKTRGPSAVWIYSSGNSTTTPMTGTFFPAAGGTDGAEGVGTQQLIGQDGTVGRTGIYALRNMVQGGTVLIAGMLDCSITQILATFCQEEACISGIALGPAGTTPDQGATTIAADNVVSRFVFTAMGWGYVIDPTTTQQQLEDPAHAIAGVISSLDPWASPLNKPTAGGKGNLIGTEWSVSQMPDETELQENNVCYIKQYGGQYVVFNDRMSDGTPIADTRMLNYLAVEIENIGTKYLGQSQPAMMNNAIITDYLNDVKALLEPFVNPKNQRITAYSVSGSADTVSSTEQGFLIGSTSVQTLSGIRYILNILQVGNSLQVQQPTTPAVLAA
jgi:hypothetical protein